MDLDLLSNQLNNGIKDFLFLIIFVSIHAILRVGFSREKIPHCAFDIHKIEDLSCMWVRFLVIGRILIEFIRDLQFFNVFSRFYTRIAF